MTQDQLIILQEMINERLEQEKDNYYRCKGTDDDYLCDEYKKNFEVTISIAKKFNIVTETTEIE